MGPLSIKGCSFRLIASVWTRVRAAVNNLHPVSDVLGVEYTIPLAGRHLEGPALYFPYDEASPYFGCALIRA